MTTITPGYTKNLTVPVVVVTGPIGGDRPRRHYTTPPVVVLPPRFVPLDREHRQQAVHALAAIFAHWLAVDGRDPDAESD